VSILASTSTTIARPPRRRGGFARAVFGALSTTRGKIGLALTLAITILAFVGPLIPGPSPTEFVGAPFALPSEASGPLGADVLGRSVLSRVLNGGWQLLILAMFATVLGVTVGALAGVVAAYRQGKVEGAIMRVVDVILAIPQLVLILLFVSIIGPLPWLVVLTVALAQAPQVTRVLYASAQDICERDFVKAVAVWGVPSWTVIRRQVLPSLVTTLAVEVGLRLSVSIVLIAGLNFLGFGVQPPDPSWGVMVNENRLGLATNLWGVVAPAAILGLLAIGTNIFADALARANLGEVRGEGAIVTATLGGPVEQ
jgi:peptide/nickel transport system permease protein